MPDTVTLYHAWSGDPAEADDWLASVRDVGLRTRAQRDPRTADNPRNQYSYLYDPDQQPPQRDDGPAQRGFTDRPTVAVTLPARDVMVSELGPDLTAARGYETWQDRWADTLVPYPRWREEKADRDYAAVEFVVRDGVPPTAVTDTYPDGLPDAGTDQPDLLAGTDAAAFDLFD